MHAFKGYIFSYLHSTCFKVNTWYHSVLYLLIVLNLFWLSVLNASSHLFKILNFCYNSPYKFSTFFRTYAFTHHYYACFFNPLSNWSSMVSNTIGFYVMINTLQFFCGHNLSMCLQPVFSAITMYYRVADLRRNSFHLKRIRSPIWRAVHFMTVYVHFLTEGDFCCATPESPTF